LNEHRESALAGVRVVDLTDERAIYGAKLLADLGAEVVRPEPPEGDPLRSRGPRAESGDSLWYAFFASSRRCFTVDPDTPAQRAILQRLVERADIVLTCDGAFAILAALEARRRTGAGQQIDLSQFEVGVNFLGPSLLDWYANGRAARPTGNRLPYDDAAPHGVYPCRAQGEGILGERWIAIACMTDAQWQALRALLGDPEWSRAPALAMAAGRVAASEHLDARIAEWTRDHDAAQLMARCQAAGVPAGVVQDGIDLAERDPQLRHTGFLQPIDEPGAPVGQTWADRLPLRFERTPCDEYHRVRLLGEDNAAVLRDWLGMSEDEVRHGEADGVLR
jgi:crotonobetainyl-CoA:carnitine CoA-transferase CaiB-like acyl-CoA transferase